MSGMDPPPPALLPPRSLIAKGQYGVCVMFCCAFAGFAGRQRVLGCCCSGQRPFIERFGERQEKQDEVRRFCGCPRLIDVCATFPLQTQSLRVQKPAD